jgi:hypothetical protein
MQPDPSMQPTTTEPKQSKGVADEVPNIFDNEEEYVGANDEHMYISIAPAQLSMNATVDSSVPTNDANEYAAAEGAIPPEEEVTDVDPDEIRVLHDPKNPRIEKGALFPDIITFRKAVRHYAVKIGFEFARGIKTDPTSLLQGVNTLLVLGIFMLQGFMIRKLFRYILLSHSVCSCTLVFIQFAPVPMYSFNLLLYPCIHGCLF